VEVAVFARHGESVYNVEGRVNGDPSVDVPLTARGAEQAIALGQALGGLDIDVCVHTRFRRTRDSARLALEGHGFRGRLACEPRLDDIRCGAMEGWSVARDHGWRAGRARDRRPLDGESVTDAALRISRGLLSMAALPERTVLVLTHELVVRYALNARRDSDDIAAPCREVPHARPFKIEREALLEAAARIRSAASGAWGRAVPGAAANGG
jgi:probable phosphoglycerate mutase